MASFYRPRVGISACLLGEAVRWDAGHRRDAYFDSKWSVADLGRFHTAHKLTLLAHSPASLRNHA